MTSSTVDLEMFCVSLMIQGMDVVSELKTYSIIAVQEFWRQRPRFATVGEMLQDKRHCLWHRLQLLHAALDGLQQQGEQLNEDFGRLQGLLRDLPTCRCDPRDRCTSCTRLPSGAPLLRRSCNIKAKRTANRRGRCPTEFLMPPVDRLDVPMNVVKVPTAVQDDGYALLGQLVRAVDEGGSWSFSSSQQQSQVPQMPAIIDRFDTPRPGRQVQVDVHESLHTIQPQTKMNIAQMYQVLARDD